MSEKSKKRKAGTRWSPETLKAKLMELFPHLEFPNIENEFTRVTDFISVLCPTHGIVKKQPHKMMTSNQGCPKCGKQRAIDSKRYSQLEIIEKFRLVHGERYDYSKVVFVDAMLKVTIGCKVHGDFEQTPQSHYMGASGCPACSIAKKPQCRPKPFSDFVKRAEAAHGNTYEYVESSYSGMGNGIEVVCQTHGAFNQNCFDHIYGAGCPKCFPGGFDASRPGYFYVYKITRGNDSFAGFGITGSISFRDMQHQESFRKAGATGVLVFKRKFSDGGFCVDLERQIKHTLPIVNTGIDGFKQEAVSWDQHSLELLQVAMSFAK